MRQPPVMGLLSRAAGVVAITIAAATLTLSPAGAAPPVAYAPPVEYETGGTGGSGPHQSGAVTADFNNDGHPDVAVANYFANGFHVLLNQGDGTFPSPGIAQPLAQSISTLVAGDFDEDGTVDLVVTNVFQVFSLHGRGDGTFSLVAKYRVLQGGQEDAQVGDFNNDGHLDVAVLARYGVHMLLGQGTGHFVNGPISFFPALASSSIDDANLNADGSLDLVAADVLLQQVYALRGNGNGSFTLTGSGLTFLVPGTVLAGDFNEDGLDDVVALNEFTLSINGAVLLNNGAGGFGPATRYDAGLGPASGELADLTNDGHVDIISNDTVAGAQVILAGDGSGLFTAAGTFHAVSGSQTPVVADFNGDGRVDIATAGASGPLGLGFGPTRLAVLLNIS